MLKLQNGWIWIVQRCGRWRKSSRRPKTPLTGQKTECPLPSVPQKHEAKAATKPSPKLQNLGHRSRCEQTHHVPDCWGTICWRSPLRSCIAKSLQSIMWPWGHKIAGKSFRRWLHLIFTNEEKFDIQQVVSQQNDRVCASSSSTEVRVVTRRPNPQSVIVWTAVTETGRSPLPFGPSRIKFNSQRYITDILESCLLSWAKKHFQRVAWSRATELCALSCLHNHPVLDSEKIPLIRKQGSLACKKPWS